MVYTSTRALLILTRVIRFGCFGHDCRCRVAMLEILTLRRYRPRDVTRGRDGH